MTIANKLSVESLVDKKTMNVQHFRRRTTAPAGKAHRDALVDFASFGPPKMRQPGRNIMNLWCVLGMPQNSWNLQGWFRSAPLGAHLNQKLIMIMHITPSKKFQLVIWRGQKWFETFLATNLVNTAIEPLGKIWKMQKSDWKKTAAEKRQLRQWPRQKVIPLTLVIRIFWKNLSDYDLRKMFYNHAVTSISSCGSDEGHLLAYWIVNYFFKNRHGKIWIGWKSFTN